MRKATILLTILALIFSLCACTSTQSETIEGEAFQGLTWQEQYDLGVRYLSEGNYEEAIIAFTAAIEIDPKRAPTYVGRGDAYVLSGETEQNLTAAKADYETAIELDETSAEAYLGLADVYIRQGDYEKALEVLQQGLEIVEDSQRVADKMEKIEAVSISAMIEQGNYGFLFTDDVVMPWDWKINGKSLDMCELSDFQLEYPNELSYGLSVYEDGFLYGPGTKNAPNGNIKVNRSSRQIEICLTGEAYFEDFYYQPDLRNIRTSDSYAEVLQKIGFSDTGVAFMKTVENDFSYTKCDSLGNENFAMTFSIQEDDTHFRDIWFFPGYMHFSEYPNARGMSIVFTFYDEGLYNVSCFYNFWT